MGPGDHKGRPYELVGVANGLHDLTLTGTGASTARPIRATGTHRFWSVTRKDWIRLEHLQVGEVLETSAGVAEVSAVEAVAGEQRVYNFEVEGAHNYRVGAAGVLVHNDDPTCPVGKGKLTESELDELQEVSDKHNAQIDVVGSRAEGKGRNIENPDLPVGKGPGTRSDIDIRYEGQKEIDSRGRLTDALKDVGNGAGSTMSSGLPERPSQRPVIQIRPNRPARRIP